MKKISAVISTGIIIGFVAGILLASFHIATNHYIGHGLFRLAALTLQKDINLTLLWTVAGCMALSLPWRFLVYAAGKMPRRFIAGIKGWRFFRRPRKAGTAKGMAYLAFSLFLLIACLNATVIIYDNTAIPDKPNVVWFLIDALRADHLGCYGYEKDTSPFIDKFASESALFTNAVSQESYTLASVSSYLTSTYPATNRVLYLRPHFDRLSPAFITLAEVLRDKGYSTAAFISNAHLSSRFNIGQGFDLYDDRIRAPGKARLPLLERCNSARMIFKRLKSYLAGHKRRPAFIYLHYMDVHSPYIPPPPYDKMFLEKKQDLSMRGHCVNVNALEKIDRRIQERALDLLISQYDGEIGHTSDYIEKTLAMLKGYGIDEMNSIIIITADHGEEFLDRHPGDPGGLQHGRTLYQEQIHVPLIISFPDKEGAGKRIGPYVELVDIVPTALDAVDIDWRKFGQFQGRSLLPLLRGDNAFARSPYSGGNHGRGMIINGRWKFLNDDIDVRGDRQNIYKRPSKDYKPALEDELYNIKTDPHEKKDLIKKKRAVARESKGELLGIEERYSSEKEAPRGTLGKKARQRLKALGYL
ncbi:MAG: sulfatase [Candidatus Omnitrophica bacterium]|nr:sulfatase [Candidatus Omnitrophota bacterium]